MSRDVVSMIGLIVGAVVLVAACDNVGKANPKTLPPLPGDGSIVCPGGGACPKESATVHGSFGVYVPTGKSTPRPPHPRGSNPSEVICPYDVNHCPSGFTGRLLRSQDYPHVTLCKPGDSATNPQCPPEAFAYMCPYDDSGNPIAPCPGRPAEK